VPPGVDEPAGFGLALTVFAFLYLLIRALESN
jgi:hypothetical protein